MAFQTGPLTAAAGAAAADAVEVSLHTDDPGATGTNEIAGGTYARQPVTWGTPSGGMVTATADPEFDVPGGNWVRWCGLWDAGGVWLAGILLDTQVEFPADGTYTISPLRVVAENPA